MTAQVEATGKTILAVLGEEITAIHLTNLCYWRHSDHATVAARAEYQRRLDRLEAIRSEFYELQRAHSQLGPFTPGTGPTSEPEKAL